MKSIKNIDIIFEDDHYIVLNKPAGIPVQTRDKEQESLEQIVSEYSTKRIFLIHRIDQVVSGICVMAKNKRAASSFQKLVQEDKIQKKYIAVVPSKESTKEYHEFSVDLFHDTERNKAFVNKRKGKKASMSYQKLGSSDRYDLLGIKIKQGRFHQIRAMLSSIDLPIKGDVKYMAKRGNKDRSIHLHAFSLSFTHPYLQEVVHFSAPLPSETLWQFFNDRYSIEIKQF